MMSRRVQSRFNEAPGTAAQVLYGRLGGAEAVPFYYNRLYNFNRDASNNVVQWADAVRGYSGPGAPPVLVPPPSTPFGTVTYDPVKGMVATGVIGTSLQAPLSSAFSLSPGPMGGPVTAQAIGTIWCVGEIDAGSSTDSELLLTANAAVTSFCALVLDVSSGNYAVVNEQGILQSAISAVPVDGTRRLIIMTSQTGQQHGIQIPNDALVQHTGESARAAEPYQFGFLGSSTLPGCSGSIAEIGGLFRTATASDIALLVANAVAQHGATLH